jgi:thiol-disulfide isomerase/thioredoxin
MSRPIVLALSLALFCGQALCADDKPARSDEAKALLETYQSTKPAPFDRAKQQDRTYVEAYMKDYQAVQLKKADLARDFADKFPDDPETSKLLFQRWMLLRGTGAEGLKKVVAETDQYLEKHPDALDPLFARAMTHLAVDPKDAATAQAVERFIKAAPKDQRGGQLLAMMAERESNKEKRAALSQRLLAEYPDSPAAEQAKGEIKQAEGVGKPFELSFTDAISGKPITMKDLRGKVVVIDFWATWCGPCIAEMPHMKEIYAKYKDQGVEFVGISLDQPEDKGGLTALKKYVADNGIGWPQYYQGKFWDGEFSRSWGILAIPQMFVVDQAGNLADSSARGKLEEIIPALLAKGRKAGEEKK